MFVDFEEAKIRIEIKRNAAADEYLRQQEWFLKTGARLKKKRDFVIVLFIIDCLLGIVAILV